VLESQLRGAGGAALAEVLERRGRGTPPTESALETLVVQRILRPFGIEVVGRQVEVIPGARVDFLLPASTILEVDGSQHLAPAHVEADRARDLRCATRGFGVMRIGPADLRQAGKTASRIHAAVRQRQAAASSPVANEAHSSA